MSSMLKALCSIHPSAWLEKGLLTWIPKNEYKTFVFLNEVLFNIFILFFVWDLAILGGGQAVIRLTSGVWRWRVIGPSTLAKVHHPNRHLMPWHGGAHHWWKPWHDVCHHFYGMVYIIVKPFEKKHTNVTFQSSMRGNKQLQWHWMHKKGIQK